MSEWKTWHFFCNDSFHLLKITFLLNSYLGILVYSVLLIEAYSQYTKHHSDLLTLKSLNFLPYDFGRIWAYIF